MTRISAPKMRCPCLGGTPPAASGSLLQSLGDKEHRHDCSSLLRKFRMHSYPVQLRRIAQSSRTTQNVASWSANRLTNLRRTESQKAADPQVPQIKVSNRFGWAGVSLLFVIWLVCMLWFVGLLFFFEYFPVFAPSVILSQ